MPILEMSLELSHIIYEKRTEVDYTTKCEI